MRGFRIGSRQWASFLLVGTGLVAIPPLLIGYGFAATGSWPGPANYFSLGLATASAPLFASQHARQATRPEKDRFALAIGLATGFSGFIFLSLPRWLLTMADRRAREEPPPTRRETRSAGFVATLSASVS